MRIKSENTKIIMGIDTSCDETSVGIVCGTKILSNIVSSQVELHRKWGGVVPGIARRAHKDMIDNVVKEALKRASINYKQDITYGSLDAIAVTQGPGLAIALEVGITKAKEISLENNIPLIAVNHMEGHLLSSLAANLNDEAPLVLTEKDFPVIGFLISGKHTQILEMNNFGEYQIIGDTLDDAVGEAYDKVARMIGLGYPGGRVLTEFAKKGNPDAFDFPIPLKGDPRLSFSFSGLKTAVFYTVKKIEEEHSSLTQTQVYDIAASFEKSAVLHLQDKLRKALESKSYSKLLVGGGVGASPKVRAGLREVAKEYDLEIFFPFDKRLYGDNGAMIAIAGYYKALRGEFWQDSFDALDRVPRLSLQKIEE